MEGSERNGQELGNCNRRCPLAAASCQLISCRLPAPQLPSLTTNAIAPIQNSGTATKGVSGQVNGCQLPDLYKVGVTRLADYSVFVWSLDSDIDASGAALLFPINNITTNDMIIPYERAAAIDTTTRKRHTKKYATYVPNGEPLSTYAPRVLGNDTSSCAVAEATRSGAR